MIFNFECKNQIHGSSIEIMFIVFLIAYSKMTRTKVPKLANIQKTLLEVKYFLIIRISNSLKILIKHLT
jgi:hypothetical protein